MCGILAVLGCHDTSLAKRARILELSCRLRHRGPDWSGLFHYKDAFLAHERLAIIDPASGDQPLFNENKSIVVAVNGEIYNHETLKKNMKRPHTYHTQSDCEVIAHLYEEVGEECVQLLDGMFSFVLLDTRDNSYIAARDPIGITPLYIGWGLDGKSLDSSENLDNDSLHTGVFEGSTEYVDENDPSKSWSVRRTSGSLWFSSEMKALVDDCETFHSFPPGHIYSSKTGTLRRWYNPPWWSGAIPSAPYDPLALRHKFEEAVVKRLMTDVPFGVLLSGGLDSSLVAAVASRHLAGTKAAKQWGAQLHTFCVGLEGSPDLKAGREVAKYLGTLHSEFTYTVQEGLDALAEVIYHIETYDVTTIRASTPMFLMARKIKALGVKMVLSGEGSDEIFGGYLYFHKAPNKEEFHQETVRKIKALHLYDCLRANKATSAWGLEARVPFLDKGFIDLAMGIDPAEKMIRKSEGRIEKYILRKAFDDEERPYLPKHILYRQKEQFSDGVGYSWIDGLKDYAAHHVTDQMLKQAAKIFPYNTPTTKEAYYYRMLFEKRFPQQCARDTVPGGPTVACSTAAAVAWDAAWSKNLDPSGRAALGVHDAAYIEEDGKPAPAPVVENGSGKIHRLADSVQQVPVTV
ncbi:hypothetical protein R1sor_014089 [Riccia sorocarpa]|uniref:Asparagine synthetase [glutamine-hydrolyzing] n=1 Tax=Riccia sorocarpa TaxID=122646 RepID=A0ABD3H8E8_9MARC